MSKPLSGLRVLDFSKALAGPIATQYMGDMGASVIKVEPCLIGDDTRGWPPFRGKRHNETGAVFMSANRNKRSLAMDLKTPRGQEIMRRLVKQADVVVVNFAPGADERLGIDEPTLRALKPDLVYCGISGYGRGGPMGQATGYDVILQAFSGIMSMTGEKDRTPVRIPVSPVDQATAMHALSAMLAALVRRGITGQGAFIELSLFECAVALLGFSLEIFWEKNELPERNGTSHESLCPYQPFATADRPMLLGVASERIWHKFCAAAGLEDMRDDPRFRTNADRTANFALTVERVQAVLKTRARDDWIALFGGIGIPCGPIHTLDEMLAHPQTAARGIIQDLHNPWLGDIKAVAYPVTFDRQPRDAGTPQPMLGEHSREVLAEIGYGPSEVAGMEADGVVVAYGGCK